jgi:hypothetical protein
MKQIFKNMIYFGADLLMQDCHGTFHYQTILKPPFTFCKQLDFFRDFYLEASMGQRIVRYVKKALDDEIYLTELRKKIDCRKTEDLYKDSSKNLSGNLLDLYKDFLHKNKPSKKSCLI